MWRGGIRAALAGLLLALAACTATGVHPAGAPTGPSGHAGAPAAGPPRWSDDQLRRIAQRILDRRAAAVRTHNEAEFLADLDRSDPRFVARQRRLFRNLTLLPLKRFSLRAEQGAWPSSFAAARWARTAYIPYVAQKMQLAGFDPEPVTTQYGVTFAPWHGHWVIVSDDDVRDRLPSGSQDAPWDLTAIAVRRSPRVLGVFDRTSVRASRMVLDWAEASIDAVRSAVPVPWRGRVVIYVLSDRSALRALGRRFMTAAAVAFGVPDDSLRPRRAVTTRVVVNPRDLPADRVWGTYLLTHEFTHVALARTTAHSPVWLQEGLADLVASRHADPRLWRPGRAALRAARRGLTEMPSSNLFGEAAPAHDYDIALAACAYLEDRYGAPAPWRLLRALAADRSEDNPDVHQDVVLRRLFGIDSHTLARRTGTWLLNAR